MLFIWTNLKHGLSNTKAAAALQHFVCEEGGLAYKKLSAQLSS
jgi:hypothetical protein